MAKEVKKTGRAKKIILSIAIAILFVLFIAYAIETTYPSPKYENYCPTLEKQPMNQTDCDAINGTWQVYPTYSSEKPGQTGVEGYCDTYTKCSKPWQDAQDKYNRNIFFVSIILGMIVVVLSILLAVESVSAGLMAGGVLLIIYGTIRYWGSLSNVFRTIMLAIALGVLIWLGYRKLK